MKVVLLFFCFLSFAFSQEIVKSNDSRALGFKLFKTKGCTMCHKKDLNSVGPSVKEISLGYNGNEKALIDYLRGKAKPIINPNKAHVMKAQFIKLDRINSKKIKAIARYIITINDREF